MLETAASLEIQRESEELVRLCSQTLLHCHSWTLFHIRAFETGMAVYVSWHEVIFMEDGKEEDVILLKIHTCACLCQWNKAIYKTAIKVNFTLSENICP